MNWSLSRGAHIALVIAAGAVGVTAVAVALVAGAPAAVRPSGAAPCVSIVNNCAPTTTFGAVTTTTEATSTTTTEPETTITFGLETTFDTTPVTVPLEVTPDTTPTTQVPASSPRVASRRVTVLPAITPASVTGSYSVGLATVLLVALGLFGAGRKGKRMNGPRRWRFFAGLGCIGLAGIVGIVGYLKLSLEPLVNRQIPYLASAGMALVLLAAVGGSLLVAEQLRTDDNRIEELEAAVRQLADAVSATVESPPRRAVK